MRADDETRVHAHICYSECIRFMVVNHDGCPWMRQWAGA